MRYPTGVLTAADQAMAHADKRTAEMVEALRGDLADGHDPAALWWTLAHAFTQCATEDLAAGFASTLLRLARS